MRMLTLSMMIRRRRKRRKRRRRRMESLQRKLKHVQSLLLVSILFFV